MSERIIGLTLLQHPSAGGSDHKTTYRGDNTGCADHHVANAPAYFHVMAKPTGAICNLDCKYCFFPDEWHQAGR